MAETLERFGEQSANDCVVLHDQSAQRVHRITPRLGRTRSPCGDAVERRRPQPSPPTLREPLLYAVTANRRANSGRIAIRTKSPIAPGSPREAPDYQEQS